MNIKDLIREKVLEQRAYPIENTACSVKLDANENPFRLPAPLQGKFIKSLREVVLNRYPDPGAPAVRRRFARYYGVGEDMLMVGNGSDELIQILCTALARKNASVAIPIPTFAMYRISALNNGLNVIELPLDRKFDLDLDRMLDVLEKRNPSLVFLSYPNNPTGNCFTRKRVEAVIRAAKGIVVVDEAYGDFSGKSFLPDLPKHDNLVILKTLSKVGLAAMRIGFMMACGPLIHELNKVRLPYNLNAMSQTAATFFLDEESSFSAQIGEIVTQRGILFDALKGIKGVRPYPSDANFIFFCCTFDIDHVYEQLIRKGFLVKSFRTLNQEQNCMRVTVGTGDENKGFIEALKAIVAQ